MKYSSSCMKPYRPLTASSTATNTAAMSQASSGTRSEGESLAGEAGVTTRTAASGGGAAEPAGWSMTVPPRQVLPGNPARSHMPPRLGCAKRHRGPEQPGGINLVYPQINEHTFLLQTLR